VLSMTAERDLLASENRALKDEVWKQRRQFRKELAVQRAEMLAMQAERMELQQLAAEAKRLVDLKEKIYSPLLEPSATPAAPLPKDETFLSEEARLNAEYVLAQQHAAVLQKMRSIRASPKVLLNLPCVLRADAKLAARMEKVRGARRPSKGCSSVGAGGRMVLSRPACGEV